MSKKGQFRQVILTADEHATLKGIYLRAMSPEADLSEDILSVFSEDIILSLVSKGLIVVQESGPNEEFFLSSAGFSLARIIASEEKPFSKALARLPDSERQDLN